MKKSLITIAGLAVLSSSAFASKARLSALGQNSGDKSYYIQDQRNTFKNPAHYATFSNFVITEWGDDNANTQTTTAVSSKAEGGFARSAGNFTYGVYLGDDGGARGTTAAGYTDQFLNDNDRLNLNFAGDAGIKWGVTLWRSAQKQEVGKTALADTNAVELDGETMGLRGGVSADNFEAYVEVDLKDEATGSTTPASSVGTDLAVDEGKDTYEADTGFTVGGNYVFGSWTAFLQYGSSGYEVNDSSDTSSTGSGSSETTSYLVGIGNERKVSDKATMWWDATWSKSETETKSIGNTAGGEANAWALDLTVALEAKANSWLTLRGSVSQAVLDNNEDVTSVGTTTYSRDSAGKGETEVAAGFTLSWDKLMLDATFTNENSGTLDLANLGSEVAVHYWF